MARTLVHRIVVWGLGITLVACTAPTAGPQGDQGPPGANGAQGIQGQQGPMGPEGPTGAFGMLPDPFLEKGLDKWSVEPSKAVLRTFAADAGTFPPGGNAVIENLDNQVAQVVSKTLTPVNTFQTYEVSGLFRVATAAGSAGKVTLQVRYFDADKVFLDKFDAALMQTPGGVSNTTNWVTYSAKFGGGTANAVPAGAQFMTVAAILNIDTGDVNGNRIYQVTGLQLRPTSPAPHAPMLQAGCNVGSPGASTWYRPVSRTYTLSRPQYATVSAKTLMSAAGTRYTYLIVNGNYRDYTMSYAAAANQYAVNSHVWTELLPAGTHSFEIETYSDYGMLCNAVYTKLVVTFQDP